MKNRKLFAIITLVAFMLTMMPLMAFAATSGDVDVWVDTDHNSAKVGNDTYAYVEINGELTESQVVYVWATINGVLTDAVDINGDYYAKVTADTKLTITSDQAGTYKLNARLVDENDVKTFNDVFNGAVGFAVSVADPTITFKTTTSEVTIDITDVELTQNKTTNDATYKNGKYTGASANSGVDYYEVTAKLLTGTDKVVGQEVEIEIDKSTGNVSKTTATTNSRGIVTFKVSATKAGTYTVTLNSKKADEVELKFVFGGSSIASISGTNPEGTVATNEDLKIVLTATDANGNVLTASEAIALLPDDYAVAYSKVPANSDIDTDKDFLNNGFAFAVNKTYSKLQLIVDGDMIDAEGNYTIKIYNQTTGVARYVDFVAADFDKAVSATIKYDAASYNLGATVAEPIVKVVDANGVTKDVTGGKFSFTGVGVYNFSSNDGSFSITSDDKYLGQTITVNVIVDKCIASTTVSIADVAAYLQFVDAQAAIGTETNVIVKSVDLQGNVAAIGADYKINEANYVIIQKPEGATVSVDPAGLTSAVGDFNTTGVTAIKVASTKEGVVKVNIVAVAQYVVEEEVVDEIYLTGTATVTFGAAPVDDGVSSTVTFIVGSNTFVANGSAYTADVAPYVVDGRTFIPVRAFAEATGAKVEYDAATQVITITAEGLNAQMTVGSNILTVNGQTTVMDTAATVTAEGRTVLPVRFAGQALGYSFEVAYGSNGAVSSVTMFK